MGKKISDFCRNIIITVKNHWFLSMILGGIIGALLSWIIGWILPSKAVEADNLPHKELTCTLNYFYQMITKRVNDNGLQVFYNGAEVESPFLYSITIENTGEYPISNEDFKEIFSIAFSGSKQIVQARVLKSSTQSIMDEISENTSIEKSIVSIDDFYLNTGESFTIHIIVDGKPERISFNARISGISNLTIRNTPKENRDVRLRNITYVAFVGVGFIAGIIVWMIIESKRTNKKIETFRAMYEKEYSSKQAGS